MNWLSEVTDNLSSLDDCVYVQGVVQNIDTAHL